MPDVLTPAATPPLHVAYTQQGDKAGDTGSGMALGARIQIQVERKKCTGQTGHRNAQVQNSDIRQRVFLART